MKAEATYTGIGIGGVAIIAGLIYLGYKKMGSPKANAVVDPTNLPLGTVPQSFDKNKWHGNIRTVSMQSMIVYNPWYAKGM